MQKLLFVYYHSENCATSQIWKVLPNMVFPELGGKMAAFWACACKLSSVDSIFTRPGSAPIWGGKKGEFRDWTSHLSDFHAYKEYASLYCSFQKHKHNISISNREHPWHKHKHKQKNEPTYSSYAVLTRIFQSLKFPNLGSFNAKSRVPVIITIPNLVPLVLQNPESRPWNKPNPGSRKTYWGPSTNSSSLSRGSSE